MQILTGKGIAGPNDLIQTSDEIYSNIECASTSKIIGRKMNTQDNVSEAIDDSLNKEIAARSKIRKIVITNKYIGGKLRILLSESLISTILLYRLHSVPISKTNLSKLQRLLPKCMRVTNEGHY